MGLGWGAVGAPRCRHRVLSDRERALEASDRERALEALRLRKGFGGSEVGEQMEVLVKEHLPPKPESPPARSTTKAERVAHLANLMQRQLGLAKRVDEGTGMVERVRAMLGADGEGIWKRLLGEMDGVPEAD